MSPDFEVEYFKPEKPGVYKCDKDKTAFCLDADDEFGKFKKAGVILYDKDLREKRFPFKTSYGTGSLYALAIKGDLSEFTYNFYIDEKVINDPYGTAFTKTESFGIVQKQPVRGIIRKNDFDWGEDKNPRIPFENSVMYGLNVRAFTMHPTSKVKNKGTFEGVVQKFDHLKDLGITTLVLMPPYEFDECLSIKNSKNPKNVDELKTNIADPKVNCWGFQKALYFAPKALYSATDDPVNSFKTLVKAAHDKNIEVLIHFYFTPDMKPSMIIDALKYWVVEFHIDGFRLSGFDIPYRDILTESILKTSKLWFAYIPEEYTHLLSEKPFYKNIACDNNGYRDVIRKFNKADEGVLNDFIRLEKANPKNVGLINYVCDYDGFTLKDLYTYERKHNEDNGENNFDGTDINHSWNCGAEGESRKKAISESRLRQIKNILVFLFIGSGTPYIFSGDELGNSRYGNNNAYCLDNEKGYVEWKENMLSRQILSFTKMMIKLRMNNPILHMKDEFKNLDTLGNGFPDLSYHGFEAWRPDLGYNSRTIGLCFYGPCSGNREARSFYVGINMHWENHRLAVPKPPKGYEYKKLFDTSEKEGLSKNNEIPVAARSISIYEISSKGSSK